MTDKEKLIQRLENCDGGPYRENYSAFYMTPDGIKHEISNLDDIDHEPNSAIEYYDGFYYIVERYKVLPVYDGNKIVGFMDCSQGNH